ncbi:MAG: ribonuclease HII [Pyrinomonadaceae bacterium]
MKDAAKFGSSKKDGSKGRVPLFKDLGFAGVGLHFEDLARLDGFAVIAGIDEVGRGCLAGDVVAAACVLDPARRLPKGLNDSKMLTTSAREEIADELREHAVAFAYGRVDAEEIDRINILEATKKAMRAAIASLVPKADFLLIDALVLRDTLLPQRSIIKGDSISASIAAASVLAKTFRDGLMRECDKEFPQYGFAGHKGYGAASHLEALRRHGPCPLHRRSFRGVLPEILDL